MRLRVGVLQMHIALGDARADAGARLFLGSRGRFFWGGRGHAQAVLDEFCQGGRGLSAGGPLDLGALGRPGNGLIPSGGAPAGAPVIMVCGQSTCTLPARSAAMVGDQDWISGLVSLMGWLQATETDCAAAAGTPACAALANSSKAAARIKKRRK